ncbi:MAG: hypothetical protein Q9160_003880 [Pyrenula sp. 1 TL-2023]
MAFTPYLYPCAFSRKQMRGSLEFEAIMEPGIESVLLDWHKTNLSNAHEMSWTYRDKGHLPYLPRPVARRPAATGDLRIYHSGRSTINGTYEPQTAVDGSYEPQTLMPRLSENEDDDFASKLELSRLPVEVSNNIMELDEGAISDQHLAANRTVIQLSGEGFTAKDATITSDLLDEHIFLTALQHGWAYAKAHFRWSLKWDKIECIEQAFAATQKRGGQEWVS